MHPSYQQLLSFVAQKVANLPPEKRGEGHFLFVQGGGGLYLLANGGKVRRLPTKVGNRGDFGFVTVGRKDKPYVAEVYAVSSGGAVSSGYASIPQGKIAVETAKDGDKRLALVAKRVLDGVIL